MSEQPKIGTVGWIDLTVPDAGELRDFYAEVTGWKPSEVDMGGYSDYCMNTEDGTPVTGVCWKKGANAELPSQWIIYITVADLDQSLERCKEKGGEIVLGPKTMGEARYCIIRDPAGAVSALYQP